MNKNEKNEKIYYYDKNAKKRVMMKRNNRITNENIIKINETTINR